MGWLSKAEEPIYALFRFVAGGLFACHGAHKLFGAFGGTQGPFAPRLVVRSWIDVSVLYCFIFLYIAARGSGRFGVDALFRKAAAA
jgi:uncharacterized membrane protein YphA (DoxX/SURF4 family)